MIYKYKAVSSTGETIEGFHEGEEDPYFYDPIIVSNYNN